MPDLCPVAILADPLPFDPAPLVAVRAAGLVLLAAPADGTTADRAAALVRHQQILALTGRAPLLPGPARAGATPPAALQEWLTAAAPRLAAAGGMSLVLSAITALLGVAVGVLAVALPVTAAPALGIAGVLLTGLGLFRVRQRDEAAALAEVQQ